MKRYLRHSLSKQTIALGLAIIQILMIAPTNDVAAAVAAELQKPEPVRANRSAPVVAPVSLYPVFSARPTNDEITRARVFEEPLIPMSGNSSEAANAQLANALTAYLKSGNAEDLRPVELFLEQNPDSVWRASLWTDMGIVYRKTGYFAKALETMPGNFQKMRLSPHRMRSPIGLWQNTQSYPRGLDAMRFSSRSLRKLRIVRSAVRPVRS